MELLKSRHVATLVTAHHTCDFQTREKHTYWTRTLTHNTERHEQQQNSLSSLSLSPKHKHIHDYRLNKLSMKTGAVAMETTGL